MTAEKRIARALRDAQMVVAAYLQPGFPNPERTIIEMFDVLDDYKLIAALEEVESGTIDAPAIVPDDTVKDEKVAGYR